MSGSKKYEKAIKSLTKINEEIRGFDDSTKYFVDVLNINEVEKIKKAAVREKTTNDKMKSLRKYGELYQAIIKSADEGIAHIQKVIALIKKIEAQSAPIKMDDLLAEDLLQE